MVREFWQKYVLPKARFASTSAIATFVDYGLFILLAYSGVSKVIANLISASCGFLVNFFLQKTFIFKSKRPIREAFGFSLVFSLGGIAIGTFFIYLLTKIPFFDQYAFVAKLLVTGIMFFYNYYTKQIAFERKINW